MFTRDSAPSGDSDLHEGFLCPLCGRGLLAVPMGTTVAFHCKGGHEFPLADLLGAQSLSLKHGLELILRDWEAQLRSLQKTAHNAQDNGFLEVAEIFTRQIRNLESRIEKIRAALIKDESRTLRPRPLSELEQS